MQVASPGTGQEVDPDSLRQGPADEVSRAGRVLRRLYRFLFEWLTKKHLASEGTVLNYPRT